MSSICEPDQHCLVSWTKWPKLWYCCQKTIEKPSDDREFQQQYTSCFCPNLMLLCCVSHAQISHLFCIISDEYISWLITLTERNKRQQQQHGQRRVGKVRLFSWTAAVWLSVLYQVCCPLLPLTFVICYKHLVSLSTLKKKRLKVGGRQRSRGRAWLTPKKKLFSNLELCILFFIFLDGLMSCLHLRHKHLPPRFPPIKKKKNHIFTCLQRNRSSAVEWVVISAVPDGEFLLLLLPPGTDLSMVSCHCRGGCWHTYIPTNICCLRSTVGSALLFSEVPLWLLYTATNCCCVRRDSPAVSSWFLLKRWQSANWKHESVPNHILLSIWHKCIMCVHPESYVEM